jgi:predicted Zn-dependent peptidase
MSNVATVAATVPSLSEFESSLHLPPGHAPIAPEKSPQDKREFRVITLPNALTALLVSDPETDKAAASMDVNVGSFAEPSETLGLAHFLEHMSDRQSRTMHRRERA